MPTMNIHAKRVKQFAKQILEPGGLSPSSCLIAKWRLNIAYFLPVSLGYNKFLIHAIFDAFILLGGLLL